MPIPKERTDLLLAPARDEVYDLLLRRIVVGDLAPGSRLNDAELLALTHSSRVPLREALNRLELVGLVVVVPRQYTEVTAIDARRTRDCVALFGAVVHQLLDETAGHLDDDDRRHVRERWSGILDDDAVALDLLGTRLTSVLLDRAGNREYRRLTESVWQYVERSLVDAAVATWRIPLRELLDRTIDGDVMAAHRAWDDCIEAMTAPFAADARPVRAPERAAVLRERAAQVIQDAILDGTLVPGETLRESELMTWLGVSRTPIRDALMLVAARGLVELTPHRPARVATLSRAAFREVTRTLGVLRRHGLRQALARPEARAQWLATYERLRSATSLDDRLETVDELSRIVEVGSENTVLADAAALLAARVRWYVRHDPSVGEVVDAGWLAGLAAAIADGRVDDAAQEMWRLHEELGGPRADQ